MTAITVTTENSIIEVSQVVTTLTSAFPAGLRGEKGEAGAISFVVPSTLPIVNSLTALAVDPVSGKLIVASQDNIGIIGRVLGITKGASSAGSYVTIIGTGGQLDGFTGLIVGAKYYLSSNGQLTTTVPTIGFIQQMGVAMSTTMLAVNLGLPISTQWE
jgi:hypothetical protein